MTERYFGPENGDLDEVYDCELLGLVSPKACDNCIPRIKGQCPQGKTNNSRYGERTK
jgi:hypothetical protein